MLCGKSGPALTQRQTLARHVVTWYSQACTTEVLLMVFSIFRETVPKARHLPTEVRGEGGYHKVVCRAHLVAIGVPPQGKKVSKTYPKIIPN